MAQIQCQSPNSVSIGINSESIVTYSVSIGSNSTPIGTDSVLIGTIGADFEQIDPN